MRFNLLSRAKNGEQPSALAFPSLMMPISADCRFSRVILATICIEDDGRVSEIYAVGGDVIVRKSRAVSQSFCFRDWQSSRAAENRRITRRLYSIDDGR